MERWRSTDNRLALFILLRGGKTETEIEKLRDSEEPAGGGRERTNTRVRDPRWFPDNRLETSGSLSR